MVSVISEARTSVIEGGVVSGDEAPFSVGACGVVPGSLLPQLIPAESRLRRIAITNNRAPSYALTRASGTPLS